MSLASSSPRPSRRTKPNSCWPFWAWTCSTICPAPACTGWPSVIGNPSVTVSTPHRRAGDAKRCTGIRDRSTCRGAMLIERRFGTPRAGHLTRRLGVIEHADQLVGVTGMAPERVLFFKTRSSDPSAGTLRPRSTIASDAGPASRSARSTAIIAIRSSAANLARARRRPRSGSGLAADRDDLAEIRPDARMSARIRGNQVFWPLEVRTMRTCAPGPPDGCSEVAHLATIRRLRCHRPDPQVRAVRRASRPNVLGGSAIVPG